MTRPYLARYFVLMAGTLASVVVLHGQSGFEVVTGKTFDTAVPRDFYLEGNAIPTEKRNAVLMKAPTGARLLFALLDTSGYSSQVQGKYIGMLVSEGSIYIGGVRIDVGSYGFGLEKVPESLNAQGKLSIYNQAGEKVGECVTVKNTHLNTPRPLQVVVKEGSARLYLGLYGIELGQ